MNADPEYHLFVNVLGTTVPFVNTEMRLVDLQTYTIFCSTSKDFTFVVDKQIISFYQSSLMIKRLINYNDITHISILPTES